MNTKVKRTEAHGVSHDVKFAPLLQVSDLETDGTSTGAANNWVAMPAKTTGILNLSGLWLITKNC